MNPMKIIFSAYKSQKFLSIFTIILIAIALSLSAGISFLEPALKRGITKAADSFDILIGASGSQSQLVLSTIYLENTPLPLIQAESSHKISSELISDQGVSWFSPLVFGDQWETSPIIGIQPALALALLNPKQDISQLKNPFMHENSAIIGALVNMNIADSFQGKHNSLETSKHEHDYEVVEKLPLTNTPWDKVILIPAETVWSVHAVEHKSEENEEAKGALSFAVDAPVSAFVIKPKNVADAYRLRAKYQSTDTISLFPAEVLIKLYAILADAQKLFAYMAILAQFAVLLSILMAVFAGMPRRKKITTLLRALGASPMYTALALWLEIFILLALGTILGFIFAYLAVNIFAVFFSAQSGIQIELLFSMKDLQLLLLSLLIASLAALLPASTCYKQSVSHMLR